MANLFEALKSLQGSYSGAFVLFWGLMLAVCLLLQLAENRRACALSRVEGALFWAFGAAMVLFAALRPMDIARDDLAYVEIFKGICPTLACDQWIQGARDWGYYSFIGVLKSVLPTPRVMLGVAALALLVKLWVIFRLTRYPLMALLLFTGVFYQMQDLTAFRVSLSLAFFMLAIWASLKRGKWLGGALLLLPGIFHKQAFLSIGLVIAPIFRARFWLLPVAMVVPFIMLWVFGKPTLPTLLTNPQDALSQHVLQQGLDAYVAAQEAGLFKADKPIPFALYPLAGLGLWLAKDVFERNRDLYSVVAASMAIGCGLLYFFSTLVVAQVRFFEFFMLPMVLLAGEAKRSWLNLLAVAAVAGAWVVRFNILHPLLI